MKRPGALHDQLGIRPHQFLLTVARLVPEKGLHDLIAATDRQSRYPVVIVGDADHPDPYSKQLREQASRHPRIIMAGLLAREPLSELYANAHGFILPSYHEGLPICLLEAMSYGLPAILSDISANRELVGEPEWVFNPGDIDHLSELLTRCQASGFPAEYGETLKLRALDQYNWNTIAHQTYELYESVLAKDV
jgi:glycosyltransferase involved in cell wall biosynthesis